MSLMKDLSSCSVFKISQTVFLVHIQLKITQDNPGLIKFLQETDSMVP